MGATRGYRILVFLVWFMLLFSLGEVFPLLRHLTVLSVVGEGNFIDVKPTYM